MKKLLLLFLLSLPAFAQGSGQFGSGSSGGGGLPAGLAFSSPTFTISSAGSGNGVLALSGNTSGTATFTAPAVAGTATNIVASSNALGVPDGTATNPGFVFNSATGTGLSKGGSGEIVMSAGTVSAFSVLGATGVTINPSGGNLAFAGGKGQHIKTQAANNDLAGTCTFAATTCTVTFTTAYAATPSCTANDRTAAAPVQAAPTTSNVVFTGGTGAGATDVINYLCVGNPN